ncbi:hypothetical protein [Mycoplasma parvum]|uniref:Uncharacterized protein n=1 Tax=Mycoplasma parvum str. Indiana TaxID=1403316 RepID=U5NBS2_9MOLU|nr:hypothetical protein [Mycoplasma parvum]AGX88832.1 hypothetical protein PRV_00235 [Mycoplasma parvum str. Indiana]
MGGAISIISRYESLSKNKALRLQDSKAKSLEDELKIDNLETHLNKINNLNNLSNAIFSEALERKSPVFDIKRSIEKITKEINKESGLSTIDSESKIELSNSQSKLTNFKENFKKVYDQVKTWESRGDSKKIRLQKGFQLPEKINPPSLEQREALLKYYEIFSNLKGNESEFLKGIDNLNKYSDYQKVGGQIPRNNREIISALKKIGWNKNSKVGFGEYLRIKNQENDDPFSILLDVEYLNDSRAKALEWEEKILAFKGANPYSKCNWKWSNHYCSSQIEASTKNFREVQEDIEAQMTVKIASILIEKMTTKLNLEEFK